MKENYSPYDSVRKNIRVFLKTMDGNIDSGYEDLNLQEDFAKIMLYMQSDTITFNNGRRYKVLDRTFQPCVPVMLYLYVEEI